MPFEAMYSAGSGIGTGRGVSRFNGLTPLLRRIEELFLLSCILASFTSSTLTRTSSSEEMPNFAPAAFDKSVTRSLTKGPLSLMRTMTDLPLSVRVILTNAPKAVVYEPLLIDCD